MFIDFLVHWLLIFMLGATLGILGGVFGIGGGIIAIPILVLAFSMDQATAQGTAAAMMVPNLVFAWYRYAKSNPVGFSMEAGGAAAVATATTWLSANLAQYTDQTLLQVMFALFLGGLGLSRLFRNRETDQKKALSARFIPSVGLVGGCCMGLLGVGGGLVAAPILTRFFGMGQRAAQSVALALVTPSAVAALSTYAAHDRVDWFVSVVLAAGGLVTVSIGVAIAHSWSEKLLQRAFGGMLLVMSLMILVKALA